MNDCPCRRPCYLTDGSYEGRSVALGVEGSGSAFPPPCFALVPSEIAWAVRRMGIGSFI